MSRGKVRVFMVVVNAALVTSWAIMRALKGGYSAPACAMCGAPSLHILRQGHLELGRACMACDARYVMRPDGPPRQVDAQAWASLVARASRA